MDGTLNSVRFWTAVASSVQLCSSTCTRSSIHLLGFLFPILGPHSSELPGLQVDFERARWRFPHLILALLGLWLRDSCHEMCVVRKLNPPRRPVCWLSFVTKPQPCNRLLLFRTTFGARRARSIPISESVERREVHRHPEPAPIKSSDVVSTDGGTVRGRALAVERITYVVGPCHPPPRPLHHLVAPIRFVSFLLSQSARVR